MIAKNIYQFYVDPNTKHFLLYINPEMFFNSIISPKQTFYFYAVKW